MCQGDIRMSEVVPKTEYAQAGDLHIAYQVLGEGPDLVWIPGWVSHVEHWWEHPRPASFIRRLATFSRVILFDKRGTGMSDRHGGIPSLDERLDDLAAVLDACNVNRPSLLGVSFEGSVIASMWAATYPERTSALILFGPTAKTVKAYDYPWGLPLGSLEVMAEVVKARWNDESFAIEMLAPTHSDDSAFREWFARWGRLSASPGAAAQLLHSLAHVDIRHVLGGVQAPALVMHRVGDQRVPIEAGRYVADAIPGARFAEIPGSDTAIFCCEADTILSEIRGFLTGVDAAPDPDRMLATILFTDIVGSTDRAASMGDAAWRDLLEQHDIKVRASVAGHEGRFVKSTGDGMLAVFDRPMRALRCASRLVHDLRLIGIPIRAGLHSGVCERIGNDIGGLAIHIAARVLSSAGPNEVLVTSGVTDLIDDSEFLFESRGSHQLKGVPETWELLTAVGPSD